MLTLLALLAALPALAVALLVWALLERAIAQLLLLADHIAELVERRPSSEGRNTRLLVLHDSTKRLRGEQFYTDANWPFR